MPITVMCPPGMKHVPAHRTARGWAAATCVRVRGLYGYGGFGAVSPEGMQWLVPEPGGGMALKPEFATLVLGQLLSHVILIPDDGDDDAVTFVDPSAYAAKYGHAPTGESGSDGENALAWVNRHLNAGFTVLAGGKDEGVKGLAVPTGGAYAKWLVAVDTPAAVVKYTSDGAFGVLARPTVQAAAAKKTQKTAAARAVLTPVTIGIGAAAIVGIIWLVSRKKR
jgi:hypothetical protein